MSSSNDGRAREREYHEQKMAEINAVVMRERLLTGVISIGAMVLVVALLFASHACGVRRDKVRALCLEQHTPQECALLNCEMFTLREAVTCAGSYKEE